MKIILASIPSGIYQDMAEAASGLPSQAGGMEAGAVVAVLLVLAGVAWVSLRARVTSLPKQDWSEPINTPRELNGRTNGPFRVE